MRPEPTGSVHFPKWLGLSLRAGRAVKRATAKRHYKQVWEVKSINNVKKYALMMCVVIVLSTFAALALARADGCTACEKGIFKRDHYEPILISNDPISCSKYPNDPTCVDYKEVYRVDEIWACSYCGLTYVEDSEILIKETCNH